MKKLLLVIAAVFTLSIASNAQVRYVFQITPSVVNFSYWGQEIDVHVDSYMVNTTTGAITQIPWSFAYGPGGPNLQVTKINHNTIRLKTLTPTTYWGMAIGITQDGTDLEADTWVNFP